MPTNYFEFEVTLLDVGPRLWRRFLLRPNLTFEDLHGAIQMACNWQFAHMWEFRDEKGIAIAEELKEEVNTPTALNVSLKSYFKEVGRECLYVYDLGDNWRHRVKLLRKVVLPERFVQHLTGGEGVFPPEDCGSVQGYEDCIKACHLTPAQIKKLDPDEREEFMTRKEWLGEWRPEGFDFKKVQERFAR